MESFQHEFHEGQTSVVLLQSFPQLGLECVAPFISGLCWTLVQMLLIFLGCIATGAFVRVLFVVPMHPLPHRKDAMQIFDETGFVFGVAIQSSAVGLPGDGVKDFVGPEVDLAKVLSQWWLVAG